MAPSNPRPQALFFYSSEWTKEIDHGFGSMLAEEAIALGRNLRRNDFDSIKAIIEKTNLQFNTTFAPKQGVDMFRKLKLRHSVYSHLLGMSGVMVDDEANVILVDNEGVWDDILEFYAMAEAYMTGTEPLWNELKVVFGDAVTHAPPLPTLEVIDLTDVVDEPVQIPPEIIEIPADIIRAPIAHMPRRASLMNNIFWNDIAEDSYIVSSQESVAQGNGRAVRNSRERTGGSSSRRRRGPRRGGALYIETSEDFQVIEEVENDRVSSEASSPQVSRHRSFTGNGGRGN